MPGSPGLGGETHLQRHGGGVWAFLIPFSPDVPPAKYSRLQLLLETGAEPLFGPCSALRGRSGFHGSGRAAAEDTRGLGLLLVRTGADGRVGGDAVLGRWNPRAMGTRSRPMPRLGDRVPLLIHGGEGPFRPLGTRHQFYPTAAAPGGTKARRDPQSG